MYFYEGRIAPTLHATIYWRVVGEDIFGTLAHPKGSGAEVRAFEDRNVDARHAMMLLPLISRRFVSRLYQRPLQVSL